MLSFAITAYVVAGLSTLVILPWLLSLCYRFKFYDLPSERKVHQSGVPRLGGIVFVPATVIGVQVAFGMMSLMGEEVPATIRTSTLLIGTGGLLLYILGVIDDLTGVSPRLKLAIQLVAAITFPLCGLRIDSLYGFCGIYNLPEVISYVLTVFVTLLVVNAVNLIDGIDGLASTLGIMALAVYGVEFYRLGNPLFVLCCSALAGTLSLFLIFNLWGDVRRRTKTFMGDSGSLFIGIVLSYFSVKYAMDQSSVLPHRPDGLLVAATTLFLPVIDLCRVALTRIVHRSSIFRADKTHIHHRLLAAGLTMKQALGALVGLQALYIVSARILFNLGVGLEWVVLAFLLVYIFILVVLPTPIAGEHAIPDPVISSETSATSETTNLHPESATREAGLVSIIMPTWNASRYVARSIDSILAQTYPHLELIIADDASSDATPDILRRYAERDSRIQLILQDTNHGAGYTRNACLKAARGQYIAFCDADDRWLPEKLQMQIDFMRQGHHALCFSPYYTCGPRDEYLGYVSAPRRIGLFQLMCDNKIGFLTAIYDTYQLGLHYMPTQRKRQDHALLLTLLRHCGAAYSVPEPLAHYRIHPDGLSANKLGLLRYNAQTYNSVFGWPAPLCWIFLFTFFLPAYIWKRFHGLCVNIYRTQLA